MQAFQTDKSGATAHLLPPNRLDVVACCGVTNKGTQWTRILDSAKGLKVCPRCIKVIRKDLGW